MDREEFEKWWHGDDTSRHPTNSYEGAMRWAYEGWVRGATAEREACAKADFDFYRRTLRAQPP